MALRCPKPKRLSHVAASEIAKLDEDALTAHKRGGRATDQPARRERVLGPLRLPPPLSVVLASFHFSSESDGVSLPQAVRSPQYTIS